MDGRVPSSDGLYLSATFPSQSLNLILYHRQTSKQRACIVAAHSVRRPSLLARPSEIKHTTAAAAVAAAAAATSAQ